MPLDDKFVAPPQGRWAAGGWRKDVGVEESGRVVAGILYRMWDRVGEVGDVGVGVAQGARLGGKGLWRGKGYWWHMRTGARVRVWSFGLGLA